MALKLTIDTTSVDDADLRDAADAAGAELAVFAVTRREVAGTRFAEHVRVISVLPEQSMFVDGLFVDGFWSERFWVSGPKVAYRQRSGLEVVGDPFEEVLAVISSGSFPRPGMRIGLAEGQQHQFRDAMILSLHTQHRRDVFVSADRRAYFKHGKREALESMLGTRIRDPAEAIKLLKGEGM